MFRGNTADVKRKDVFFILKFHVLSFIISVTFPDDLGLCSGTDVV